MSNTCKIDLLQGDILISSNNPISDNQVIILGGVDFS